MIRNFCIDCMITCAVFMILWGCLPALLADQLEGNGPPEGLFTEDTLPPGVKLVKGNTCCYWFGRSKPCDENRDFGDLKCASKGVSCSRGYMTCVCKDTAKKAAGTWNGKQLYFWKCECGG